MKNNLLLSVCGISLPLLSGNEILHAENNIRPNILTIVCEDISPYLGCYGDEIAVSPNLDQFSLEGIRYTGMYTTMGVSSPSRAALITGMYPTSIGANNMRTAQNKSKPAGIKPYEVVLPEGVKCFTEFLREAGYYCTNNSKTDYQFEAPLTAWDEQGVKAHWKNAPNDMPFFSIFNLNVTHEFKIMENADCPLGVEPNEIILPPYFPDDPIVRKDMAVMYSNIQKMDIQFQELLDELKTSDRFDNTIVIFYSDNGGPLPRQKREIYESGTLVPFMIRFPDGYGAGTVDNSLHMFIDIPATILSLTGVSIPDYMHGQAFLGSQKCAQRKYVYGARDRVDTFYDKQACVRDDRFRYIRNYKPQQSGYLPIISRSTMPMMKRMVELLESDKLNEDQARWFLPSRPKIELYDLNNDPHELNNLADKKEYAGKIRELSNELDNWINDYNDIWSYSEIELINNFWPNGNQLKVEQPIVNIQHGYAHITCSTPGASIAYQINGKGINQDHWLLYSKPFAVDKGDIITTIGTRAGYKDSSLQSEASALLMEWVDTLLTYQVSHFSSALDGGLLCPACGRIHGRCGDAIFPLMYAAEKTSNPKYVNSAKRLMSWMENIRQSDGSWMNDINVSDWNGTTVFFAISLYETLDNYSYLLDDSTIFVWEDRLLKAGDFIKENDFIYSRKRDGMKNMNINYSASALYALYAIGKMFDRLDFINKSKEISVDIKSFFTESDYFLYGEGPEIWNKTKNGCLPVDLLYNVEESLPNMMLYAEMSGDKELRELLVRSMDTHLEFMLPDGAWDNSWGTRNFKWAYWGGRTSDGFMCGFSLPNPYEYPKYYEAIRRNIELLKTSTHNGLLQGGFNLKDFGLESCIHHTFGHAKALTAFLNQTVYTPQRVSLPRDSAYGIKFFKDINTALVAVSDWRATITAFDAEYKVKGTHPMGGVLSMLWHKSVGPVFAASMNEYSMIEPPNMQSYKEDVRMSATPRVEVTQDGIVYSNLDDLDSKIDYYEKDGSIYFRIKTHLVDTSQQFPFDNDNSVEISYTFNDNDDVIIIECKVSDSLIDLNPQLILPIISSPDEEINFSNNTFTVKKDDKSLNVNSSSIIELLQTSDNGRVFNPVPGFSFIPISINLSDKDSILTTINLK